MIARHRSSRTRLVTVLVALIVVASGTSASAEEVPDPSNVTPPTVTGLAQWGENLTADPGTWDPAETPLAYQWMRNGAPVAGETGTSYRINEAADLSKVFSVRVQPVGRPDLAVTSAATERAVRATFENTKRPSISGTLKYRKTLTASPGSWSRGALRFRFQWFSAGKPVKGATSQRFSPRPQDVGHTIRVEVTATRAGFETRTVTSRSTSTIQHVTPVRKTVTYSVRTRGKITQSLTTFKKLAQETLDDPRGWRANGIRFKRVSSGGSFTLVLSEASKVPSYSSACSSSWSCRVGRYVHHQPEPLALGDAVVEQGERIAARLPRHGGQSRGGPLAGPRPRLVLQARISRTGHAAAVQEPAGVHVQPLAQDQRAVLAALPLLRFSRPGGRWR